ncbi:hypothetical protein WJX75_003226 [Coccomyxa subellipsoidea]|uniref:Uncharacterized protein n=1 Tax=Coccomyxa subellipsoidea TaxID=248742 RepID=A0ABR2YKL3_9CHLO
MYTIIKQASQLREPVSAPFVADGVVVGTLQCAHFGWIAPAPRAGADVPFKLAALRVEEGRVGTRLALMAPGAGRHAVCGCGLPDPRLQGLKGCKFPSHSMAFAGVKARTCNVAQSISIRIPSTFCHFTRDNGAPIHGTGTLAVTFTCNVISIG